MVREISVRLHLRVLWKRLYCTDKDRSFVAIKRQCCVFFKEEDSVKGFRDWSINLYISGPSWSDHYRVPMDCIQPILAFIFQCPDL